MKIKEYKELQRQLKNEITPREAMKKLRSECYELIEAINDNLRENSEASFCGMYEEMADVSVMIDRIYFCMGDYDESNRERLQIGIYKMRRALKRIRTED